VPRVTGSRAGLPGYAWDTRLRNYVDLSTGRMVKRAAVVDMLDGVLQRSSGTVERLALSAHDGTLTPRQFYEAMQREVRLANNAAAALAKGGWAQMTQSDWGRNGALLREEYRHLRGFAADIAEGKLSPAQVAARAKLYADSAWRRYWEVHEGQMTEAGKGEEHWRTRGDDRVCAVCLELEARGWQPIGSMPVPGSIHAGCRCGKDFK
jgi:hypothetical protein